MDKKNILLVDDDDIFNYIHTMLLKRIPDAGVISIAKNGIEALAVLKECDGNDKQFPDIVLLDLNMPVMNGFDFLRTYNELDISRKKDIQVVILTSSTHPGDRKKALALGAREFYSKPLDENMVGDILRLKP